MNSSQIGSTSKREVAPRASSSPRIRTVIKLCVAVIGVVVCVAFAQMAWAGYHMYKGGQDLDSALRSTRTPAAMKNPVLRNETLTLLRRAQAEFRDSGDDMTIWTPIVQRTGWLPVIGSTVANTPEMSRAAYYATSSALLIAEGAALMYTVVGNKHRYQQVLPLLAQALAPGEGKFIAATRDANAAAVAMRHIPSHTGLANFDNAVARLRANVPKLRAASLWLTVAPSLLGHRKDTQLLFAWENSAEIRPVGGLIGAGDLMTLHNGQLKNWFTGSQMTHEAYFPHVPLPEAVNTYETSFRFLDSNASPDFPTSARLERWTFGNDTGHWADGVIDFVDQGVPDMLAATGPIYLPAYHVTVTTHNAIRLANHFAGPKNTYRGPQHDANQDTRRKQFLGIEFDALVQKIEQMPVKAWPRLATALTFAIAHRDIQMFDERPVVEEAIQAVGADGTLTAPAGDFLAIVDDNRSYNKIAPYVHESASYTADLLPNLWVDATVTIHYHLDPSPSDLEGEGPCFGTCGTKHDFRDFLRVLVPFGATSAQHTSSLHQISAFSQPAYGLTQFAGWFQMSPGQDRTITIQYAVPANVFAASNYEKYTLTVARQAGSGLSSLKFNLVGLNGVSLAGARKRGGISTVHTTLNMDRGRTVTFGITRHEQPATVVEPLAGDRDPYIPYDAFKGKHPL